MTTIFTKKALTSIKYSGDVTVKGQLGKLIIYRNINQRTFTITEFYYIYNVNFIIVDPTYEIILPAIDSSVLVGWKAIFIVNVVFSPTTVNQKINLISSSGTIVYTINTLERLQGASNISIRVFFSITAIGPTTNDWLIEVNNIISGATLLNSYSSTLLNKSIPIIGKSTLQNSAGTNINVLFATPAVLTFTGSVFNIDSQFYTFNSPSTRITFPVTGSYYLEYNIIVTAGGGATTTNCQFAVRLNGITTLPGFSITQTGFNSMLYTLKAFMTLSAGDYIEIIAGRSATSAGTLTVNTTSVLNIICFGV